MSLSGIDWWRIAEVVGVWAAAFATYFAARVALRIAAGQDEIRLKVSVLDGVAIGDGPTMDVVWITIVNTARRRAIVTGLSWRFSRFTKIALYHKVDPPNPQLPVALNDGDTLTITIPVEHSERDNWYEMLAERFHRFGFLRRNLELQFFRLEVATSTGVSFFCRPHGSFMSALRTAISSKSEKQQGAKT